MGTITSANSTLALGVKSLFVVPQVIAGYGSDDAYSIDQVDVTETKLGVDGVLSAGRVPQIKIMTVTLQADSPSNLLFETLYAQQEGSGEVLECFGVLSQPSISMSYVLSTGWLKGYTPLAAAKKTLEQRTFTIEFGSVVGVPL